MKPLMDGLTRAAVLLAAISLLLIAAVLVGLWLVVKARVGCDRTISVG